jgi:hypothetical protein
MLFQNLRPYIAAAALAMFSACASAPRSQPPVVATTRTTAAGGQITAEMIGARYGTVELRATADDPSYGYSERAPIRVGGGFGSKNHYAFLNSLAGPHGETVHYERVGSCCGFDAPNSPFGRGMLEVFTVSYEGGASKTVYFDWYNEEPLMVPLGLTAKR